MNKIDFSNKTFVTESSEETKKLGRDFAKSLTKGDIVCLYGDMGSGKTTFVQGLAEGLEIKQRIISPTFIMIRQYKARINDKGLMINDFYHIDLYRMGSKRDIESLGIEEIINNKDNIVVIEWAQNLKNLMPEKRIVVQFYYTGENKRKVTFALGF